MIMEAEVQAGNLFAATGHKSLADDEEMNKEIEKLKMAKETL